MTGARAGWFELAIDRRRLAFLEWARIATDASAVAEARALATPDDLAHAARFRFAADQRRGLVRRAAVRRLLAARLGGAPGRLMIRRGALGQPFLENSGIEMSVAYADDLVLVATSEVGPVGCDIARLDGGPASWPGADTLLSAREVAWVAARDACAFIRVWTLKEAWGKALGCGLAGSLDAYETINLGPGPSCTRQAGRVWGLHTWECMPGYQAAVVVRADTSLVVSGGTSAHMAQVQGRACREEWHGC